MTALTASGQEFEVASVKPAIGPELPAGVADAIGFSGDAGRIRYHGVTLKAVLARAYGMPPDQVSGPDWLESERYTIEATLLPNTDADQLRLMLQRLLTERFGIRLHKEGKETPVYRLKVAKNGPKLLPPAVEPTYQSDDERRTATRDQAIAALERQVAEMKSGSPYTSSWTRTGTTAQFADGLSGRVDRPVRDMTQLDGKYRFPLRWGGDTSIYTAIEEQLGLKLEAGKEAIEWLVIDRADKIPTGN